MKKICIVTNIPTPYRVDFFNYLIENFKNYDFKIIYSSTSEDDRGWNLDKKKIKNSYFLNSKSIIIKEKLDNKHIHFNFKIKKILNTYNPDIIIGCEYNPVTVNAYLWAKFNNKKYISWSDGTLNSEKNINFIQKIIRKVICKNSDALIASSSKTKEAQLKYGAKENNIFLSYLTINIDEYLYKKNKFNNKNILFVGRLSKRKGLELLMNSLALLRCEYKLIIVGDGPYKKELEKYSKDLKINENILFKGALNGENLINEYRNADLFVIASYVDCFGLVISEAMSNSMPIIASKYVDGAYDLIDNGLNGYIVDPEDFNEFSNRIQYILSDRKKVEDMGKYSYEKIKKFSFENVHKGVIEAIKYVSKN
ncbi:glycosyltransferase [Clostridium perfringens]|uniref:glycosyltransferase n=1 Tax=Clostridium perfringens TaxID=1502 RepID=UPI0034A52869